MKIYYINQDLTQEINFSFLCKHMNKYTLSIFPYSYIINSSYELQMILPATLVLAIVATSMSMIDYKPKLERMKEETSKYNTIKAYNEMLKEKAGLNTQCTNADTTKLNKGE